MVSNLDIHPGELLDHFRLDSVVAASGMATVFRATDLNTGNLVAIKVPHPETEHDPVLIQRFHREEEIGTRLDHPGVMKVVPNVDRSRNYIVMEWVPGRLLRSLLNEEKRLPVARAVHLTIGICEALQYIHNNGVAHRDMKPENVMVDEHDNIRIIDFGIAANAGSHRLTFASFSQGMGTPDYISPEQVKGKRGDARSDVYSVGIMLYEMLTGRVPFTGPNPFAVMNARLLNQPVPPRELEPSVTPQVQEIVYRALERDPRNRYASAREFAHDLHNQEEVGLADRTSESNWQQRGPRIDRRRIIFYAAVAMLPILILVLLLLVAHKR
jgi:serine/threonine protein kinase